MPQPDCRDAYPSPDQLGVTQTHSSSQPTPSYASPSAMWNQNLATEEVIASYNWVKWDQSLLTHEVSSELLSFAERGSRGLIFFCLAEDKLLEGGLLQAVRLIHEEPEESASHWGGQEVKWGILTGPVL